MPKVIAFFDFDSTITTKDSFLEMIKFHKGKAAFYLGFALLMPVLVLYKMKLIPNWKAKEIVLQYFFKNTPIAIFNDAAKQFAETEIPKMLRPAAIEKLNWHRENNHRIVIVSASATQWLMDWADALNVELIGTELEIKNEKVTGKLASANCFGIEKANRINAAINLAEYAEIYAYGDSSGDREMLALATKPFFKGF